jgi:hypothetical protein
MSLEEPPCSNTSEWVWCEETYEGHPSGGGDPDGAGGGVLVSLGGGLLSTEGERSRLRPLFVLHCWKADSKREKP